MELKKPVENSSEAPKPAAPPVPQVGTPANPAPPAVGTKIAATIGTPTSTVGVAKAPSTPVATTTPPVSAPRPAASPAIPSKPSTPPKKEESKQEVSRRNFMRGLAILGGLVVIAGPLATLGPYLQGSVSSSNVTSQVIYDLSTNTPIRTTDVSENNWKTFVYPRTGNPNIDNDTFKQCVIIHLPKGFTAPSSKSAVDPISGDTFVALSRVCVHLWCLWSYVPNDRRAECPCHGSQYVPGGVPGSQGAGNPGIAVAGPASLQTPPNNQLPLVTISIASDGTISATGLIGQIGCGQYC